MAAIRKPGATVLQMDKSGPGPSHAHAAEGELLQRVRMGDEQAMAQLYDRFSPVVYGAALRVLGDSAAAEDVLQDVFVQLWRNPQIFDANRGSMAAWLAVIARHRAIDQRRKRRPESDFEEVVLAVDPGLDGLAERTEAIDHIRRVLATMPEAQRCALEMAFFEGLTHTEIAEKTGEPLGTIKTRIRSALTTIRKALARE
jgi:RNA polymerase sigma-70 factor, ECF subfamily